MSYHVFPEENSFCFSKRDFNENPYQFETISNSSIVLRNENIQESSKSNDSSFKNYYNRSLHQELIELKVEIQRKNFTIVFILTLFILGYF